MDWQEIYLNSFKRTVTMLEKQLDQLSPATLNQRPEAGCNSIGWIAWHIARAMDRHLSDVLASEQIYLRDGWYAKFGREADPKDSGTGHSPETAAAFTVPDAATLIGYHNAVIEHFAGLIAALPESDLDQPPRCPEARAGSTIGGWLGGMLGHSYQHLGEIGYLRGLLKL